MEKAEKINLAYSNKEKTSFDNYFKDYEILNDRIESVIGKETMKIVYDSFKSLKGIEATPGNKKIIDDLIKSVDNPNKLALISSSLAQTVNLVHLISDIEKTEVGGAVNGLAVYEKDKDNAINYRRKLSNAFGKSVFELEEKSSAMQAEAHSLKAKSSTLSNEEKRRISEKNEDVLLYFNVKAAELSVSFFKTKKPER